MTIGHRRNSDDYSVGWICALPSENDKSTYTYGEIHGNNIVMTCLPSGGYGTTSAAVAAQQMNTSFRSLQYRFMVGVGGGVPSESNDIRLGDIVVSRSEGKEPGVIQFPKRLAATLAAVLTNGELIQSPGYHSARLFSSSYPHPESKSTCDECDQQWLVHRKARPSESPHVHYGLIASGNQVIKDTIERDKLAKSRNILCFEMEAVGLMNDFECLVVRGICDYADLHKNKTWQPYATATAAAYVKTLLEIPPELDEELCRLFVTDPNENRRSLMARRGRPRKTHVNGSLRQMHWPSH
ncbi:nucleoside phosphorylase domain-containing protein [Aspergillus minisclerotigenes]|uniref:Nucleoside phosphorylase domain-containing protein n=1 Tax=Aspergillus minisclerotigenes TaxID=656917 RepID=A0A5N6IZX9_9EURO|nr:nucleoside phosphorylase domain-containing protein [Aspergillus minisclerotigenes]